MVKGYLGLNWLRNLTTLILVSHPQVRDAIHYVGDDVEYPTSLGLTAPREVACVIRNLETKFSDDIYGLRIMWLI